MIMVSKMSRFHKPAIQLRPSRAFWRMWNASPSTLHSNLMRQITAVLLGLVVMGVGHPGAAEPLETDVFATVNGIAIPGKEYLSILRTEARKKFYHGKAPEFELAAFRRVVGESLIRRMLFAREAERRGLQANEVEVAKHIAAFENKFMDRPQWEKHRESFVSRVGQRLREESRIKILEARIRDIAPATEAQLRAYYRENPDKFTTPEKIGVSVIALHVAVGSPSEDWEKAKENLEKLRERLQQGEEFEVLARGHSQDPSAGNGGDLGFQHRRMLGSSVQEALDKLEPDQTTPVVQTLEGYGLFRLNARNPARLNPLEKVKARAKGLWLRQAKDRAWKQFGTRLRDVAVIHLNESYYQHSPIGIKLDKAAMKASP